MEGVDDQLLTISLWGGYCRRAQPGRETGLVSRWHWRRVDHRTARSRRKWEWCGRSAQHARRWSGHGRREATCPPRTGDQPPW